MRGVDVEGGSEGGEGVTHGGRGRPWLDHSGARFKLKEVMAHVLLDGPVHELQRGGAIRVN